MTEVEHLQPPMLLSILHTWNIIVLPVLLLFSALARSHFFISRHVLQRPTPAGSSMSCSQRSHYILDCYFVLRFSVFRAFFLALVPVCNPPPNFYLYSLAISIPARSPRVNALKDRAKHFNSDYTLNIVQNTLPSFPFACFRGPWTLLIRVFSVFSMEPRAVELNSVCQRQSGYPKQVHGIQYFHLRTIVWITSRRTSYHWSFSWLLRACNISPFFYIMRSVNALWFYCEHINPRYPGWIWLLHPIPFLSPSLELPIVIHKHFFQKLSKTDIVPHVAVRLERIAVWKSWRKFLTSSYTCFDQQIRAILLSVQWISEEGCQKQDHHQTLCLSHGCISVTSESSPGFLR